MVSVQSSDKRHSQASFNYVHPLGPQMRCDHKTFVATSCIQAMDSRYNARYSRLSDADWMTKAFPKQLDPLFLQREFSVVECLPTLHGALAVFGCTSVDQLYKGSYCKSHSHTLEQGLSWMIDLMYASRTPMSTRTFGMGAVVYWSNLALPKFPGGL